MMIDCCEFRACTRSRKGKRWIAFFGTVVGVACLFLPAICNGSTDALDYDEVVRKAIDNAYNVRMSRVDISISKAERKRAYSLYYPTISGRWNTEYVKDLTDGEYQLTAVGNTVLVQNTMYQSSFLLAGTYNLFDFGATGKKVFVAEKDVDLKRTLYKKAIRDIKIKVLDVYTDLLTGYTELKIKKELLHLYKDLALSKERLYKAGKISRIEMLDEAVKTVRVADDIDNLQLKLKSLLNDLSSLTGERYSAKEMKINDFKEEKGEYTGTFDPADSLESRLYDLEIEKKEAELEILKKGNFPQVGLYSNYIWYTNHPSECDTSVQYIKPRNFFVGLAINIPIFEGFKTSAQIEKAKLEVKRLKIEKEKQLMEITNRHAKLSEAQETYRNSADNRKDVLRKVQDKLDMSGRLSEKQLIEWADLLNRKVELLNERYELTKTMIAKISTTKELNILSGADQ